jgi:hypothetical protein
VLRYLMLLLTMLGKHVSGDARRPAGNCTGIGERGAHPMNERRVELAQLQPGHTVVDLAADLGKFAFTAACQVGATRHGDPYGLSIAPKSC